MSYLNNKNLFIILGIVLSLIFFKKIWNDDYFRGIITGFMLCIILEVSAVLLYIKYRMKVHDDASKITLNTGKIYQI